VTAPEYQAMPDQTHVAFALSPRARAVWPMLPRLRLSMGAGPEMVLNRVDYVVRTPAREELISPWPVRLRVDAGLAATLW
jgi:hypothetical protein